MQPFPGDCPLRLPRGQEERIACWGKVGFEARWGLYPRICTAAPSPARCNGTCMTAGIEPGNVIYRAEELHTKRRGCHIYRYLVMFRASLFLTISLNSTRQSKSPKHLLSLSSFPSARPVLLCSRVHSPHIPTPKSQCTRRRQSLYREPPTKCAGHPSHNVHIRTSTLWAQG